MTSHWDTLCACDFFSVEAMGITGTVRSMVFFVYSAFVLFRGGAGQ
jgi:hypothetical protein